MFVVPVVQAMTAFSSTISSQLAHTLEAPDDSTERLLRDAVATAVSLERWFGVQFAIFDGRSGDLLHPAPAQPDIDWPNRSELLREVAQGNRPAWIAEVGPVAALAVPLALEDGDSLVALGLFVTRPVTGADDVAQAADSFGVAPDALAAWIEDRQPVSSNLLERMADLAIGKLLADLRVEKLESDVDKLSNKIGSTYEEISLIYRLTQNLKISGNAEDLGRMALRWLAEVSPAKGLAIQLNPNASGELLPDAPLSPPTLLTFGRCPIDGAEFSRLLDHLGLDASSGPVVINRSITDDPAWPFPTIQEMMIVSLAESDHVFGWLAAFNHQSGAEFGTVEASLLSSVGTILGIHSSNIELYRQQAETLADVVRAMSSAIDAKDPYTHGHSDRVARVAVRLAKEMGCDQETVKTIYLSGLLHDIGKIGIDDNVLRKPGKLTDAEFEHVKAHVTIGYKILKDLRKMGHMLPVVLHHHEAFDGTGYPHGLAGKNIPHLARIVAVADAYDAMASDRPYRPGMPKEKIDAIITKGAGTQWDPEVVDAFFRARADILEISVRGADPTDLGALHWS
jgi:hypothetical protein